MKNNHRQGKLVVGPSALIVVAMLVGMSAGAAVISGEVKAPRDKNPVAGALIELPELHRSATTGADGTFRFTGVPDGRYTLRVTIPGGTRSVEKRIDVSGEEAITADVVLEPGVRPGQSATPVIVVSASRLLSEAAREVEREAPNIIAVVTAEEIRKLPDVSVAEAIRRLPGVSAENDSGEARYINIRGLDADLNGTTFAGVRLLPTNPSSPLGGGRAVAFDTIPAGLVGALTVTKTNIPEMDAEALGGTIEITPKRLAPNDAPFLSGRIGSGYEPLRDTKILDLEISGGTRFGIGGDRPISAVGSIAVYNDRRGIDDLEETYIDGQLSGIPDKAFNDLRQRYYRLQRKRLGVGGELAYQPSERHRWYVDAYQSGYTEDQNKDYFVTTFSGSPTVSATNPNVFMDTVANYDRSATDHTETLRARLYSFGGRDLLGGSVLDYRLSYTEGRYIVSKDFGWDFLATATTPPVIAYDNTTRPNWPSYQIGPGGPNPYDPSSYTLSNVVNGSENDLDKEISTVVNWAFPVQVFGDREELKVGASARLRNKTTRPQPISLLNVPPVSLSPFVSNHYITFYDHHYSNGYAFDLGSLENYWAAGLANGTLVPDTASNAIAAEQSYQHNQEDVYAAYGQYKYTRGALGILTGVRIEETRAKYSANAFSDATLIGLSTQGNNYTNAFPTFQVRYELAPTLVVRGSVSSAIARPGFQQITAAVSASPSGLSISQGNPALKPTSGYNIDLGLDKYFEDGGMLMFGLFDKELKNYITQTIQFVNSSQLPPTPAYAGFPPNTIIPVTSYANISHARVTGTEIAWEQKFEGLPGILNGLGAGANWTWVTSRGDIRPGVRSMLPSSARNTVNVELFYERRGFEVKLAGYYTARVLFAPNFSDPSGYLDSYQSERYLLDLGMSYALNRHAGLYLNFKNLTNNPMRYTEGPENRPIQREFYGITVQTGVSFQF